MSTNHALYYAAIAADDSWHSALVRQFKKNAGDVRYTAKGKGAPGSALRTLHDEAMTAREAWWNEMRGTA